METGRERKGQRDGREREGGGGERAKEGGRAGIETNQ